MTSLASGSSNGKQPIATSAPLPGKRDRGGASDARIAARDERLSANEPTGTSVTLFPVIRPRFHLRCETRSRLRLPLERLLRSKVDWVLKDVECRLGRFFLRDATP
jgi:hypothetical protein